MSGGAGLGRLEIMNIAVDLLLEAPLASPTQPGKIGNSLRRNFGLALDTELQGHPWNCATVRTKLATTTTAPVFGWTYAFPLPAQTLRVYDLSYNGAFEGPSVPYAVENDGADNIVIMTNQAAPLYLKTIRRVQSLGILPPLLCDLIGANLARRVCHSITGKASLLDRINEFYKETERKAKVADAQEGTPERPIGDDWDNARSQPADGSA
jgi:hypothetical protein